MRNNSKIDDLIDAYGLDKLNSMTKYPSILTYHDLGERGTLKDSLVENKSFDNQDVYITEKIDGTNSRIVTYGGDYLIGSREEFLYAKGDRFGNPDLHIVETIKDIANNIANKLDSNKLFVIYGETYGKNIGQHSKEYSIDKSKSNFRIFDIISIDLLDLKNVLKLSRDKIASWRDHNGQKFMNIDDIDKYSRYLDIQKVPYISKIDGSVIPKSLEDTYEWLQKFSNSNAIINEGKGKSEGVVVRNYDRSLIRKIRFEDYEKSHKKGLF